MNKLIKHFFIILINIIAILLINANCFAVKQFPNSNIFSKYTFNFYYDNGMGDNYTGFVFAPKNIGYSVGYIKSTKDENGNTGYYKITAESKNYLYNDYNKGKVYINTLYDNESNKSYIPIDNNIAAGINYLGSEYGYIKDNKNQEHYFGGGYFEADLISNLYEFKYIYSDGDHFLGKVYAQEDYGYYPGYTQSVTDATGTIGTYQITAASSTAVDASLAGDVLVNSYYDAASQKTFTPLNSSSALGSGYLGSEQGYIIDNNSLVHQFTDTHAADLLTTSYSFSYTYGNGDSYLGTVNAREDYGYYPGYTQSTTDENGQIGTYQITATSHAAVDAGMAGKVLVSSYYDAETGRYYTPIHSGVAVGNQYLGTESDYILNKTYSNEIVKIAEGIKEFQFGNATVDNKRVNYEADVANIYDVKNYGAKADSITDDSGAIQITIDQAYANGGGFVVFPSGIYSVKTVNIREGITYYGDNATLLRPAMQPNWTRTFTTQNTIYSGIIDSKPLIIRGLAFDGDSQNQGPYQNWELEQSHFIFLMGDKNYPGRLKAVIEDCYFKNGVADAINAYVNVDVTVNNCTAENVFRGGFVSGGGYTIGNIINFTTKGTIDPTGIDIETCAMGYGNTYKSIFNFENLNLINGDFDVAVKDGSIVTGNNIYADAPFNLYCENSKAIFNNSVFFVSNNKIWYPNDVTFNNCSFYASEKTIPEGNNILSAAPYVMWQSNYAKFSNQKLSFNDCNFTVGGDVEISDTVYGILTGLDDITCNNLLTVNGGHFSENLDVGIAMQYGGGNWIIKDSTFDSNLALSWMARTNYPNCYVNILIDNVNINSQKFINVEDSTPAESKFNKLEIRNVQLNETSNFIQSSYGLGGIQYTGNRLIEGVGEPTINMHGFIGDIYTDNISNWICTKAGYFDSRYQKYIPSQWTKILN